MALLKTIWQVTMLLSCFGFMGLFAKATYELGKSALLLHEKGLVNIAKYNRLLVGNSEFDR